MDALRPASESGVLSRVALFLAVSMVAGVLAAGLALPVLGGLGLAAQKGAEEFESLPAELETPPLPERSRILAADGSQIATFFFENRVSIPLKDVAPVMRQAVVAIEDARFYDHGGVDVRGTVRAFINNQSGDDVQGGSTLTQQYVKQVLLESAQNIEDEKKRAEAQRSATEQSYSRKLRELRYAVALEEKLSKDEILERYLNIAYFGAGAYGIETAARHYFSIPAKELTLTQAALLAGVIQQPTAFDPTRNPERAQQRRNIVLERMAEVGYASRSEVDEAKAADLGLKVPKSVGNGCDTSRAPFFCNYVLNVIKNDKTFGETKTERLRLLLRGGLTITTTLDRRVQKAARAALREYVKPTDKVASALVSVEPGTGHVKAIALSRRFGKGKGKTKLNYAVDKAYEGGSGFQAGSTFKPFVAVAALEQGFPFSYTIYSPYQATIGNVESCQGTLSDSQTVSRTPYQPFNETESENGSYTMRQGMALSINTYWLQMQERTGVCRPFTVATEMGLRRADGKPLQQVKSFALGPNEVSPLRMAEAYATFAARGTHCSAVVIRRIVDPNGQRLKVPQANCRKVIDPRIADGINHLLQEVMINGTGARARLNGRPSAGKTGTTNRRVSVWFIGYTPQLATAVWAGNPSPPRGGYPLVNRVIGGRYYGNVCGGCLPGPIWKMMMDKALEDEPPEDFVDPPSYNFSGTSIRVPNLVGFPPDEAVAILEAAGLRGAVVKRRVESEFAEKGRVAATDPETGVALYEGQRVRIILSKGPPAEAPGEAASPQPSAAAAAEPRRSNRGRQGCKKGKKKNC